MVLPAEVDSVHVHTAIVGPVVGQSNNELDIRLGGAFNHLVETREINCRLAILPPLEHAIVLATSVLREPTGVVSDILVVETPSAEYTKPRVMSGA